MDISKETSIEKLKALAFDTIGRIEMEQNNLRILQQRIAELGKEEVKKEK